MKSGVVRLSLSSCFFIILLVGLVLALVAGKLEYSRLLSRLELSARMADDLSTIVNSGKLALRYCDLHNNSPCDLRDVLRHDLAMAVLHHWQHHESVDTFVKSKDYAAKFSGMALVVLGCQNGNDFFELARKELWLYPDDELIGSIDRLSDESKADFERFVIFAKVEIEQNRK